MAANQRMSSFNNFVKGRAEAEQQLLNEKATPLKPGAILLLGSDIELLGKLARTAVNTEGANLDTILKFSSDIAVVGTSSILTLDLNSEKSAELVESIINTNIGPVIYVREGGASREPSSCCSHEFEVVPGHEDQIAADFQRLIKVLRCPPGPCLGPGTYYVSLTYPDLSEAMDCGEKWTPPEWSVSDKGDNLHNALEVRADLLRDWDETFVLSQLALVRRRSDGLPIIFTVRTRSQGGAFPNDEKAAWELMMVGLRFGVEYVDVEASMSREGRFAFIQMARVSHPGLRVIGSYHDIQRPLSEIPDSSLAAIFHECAYGPKDSIDIVKVVCRAESVQCSIRINQTGDSVRPSLPKSVHSIIAICTTEAGRLSRALNIMLGPTPVAHPALPGIAAPGQLSATEIEKIRQVLGLDPNPFWTFTDINPKRTSSGKPLETTTNVKRRKFDGAQ
eukprot:m.104254 g.104254  ORF g.104254 m.104254 type:complete len:449 (+) comp27557_c0_seq9:354-1700(+)